MAKNKTRVYISFILDESGSMQSCKDSTISGFNEYLEDQKKEDREVFFSLTKFNTTCDVLHTAVPVDDVDNLNIDSYSPNGLTALYDAIGLSIRSLELRMQRDDGTSAVLFVIMTDGHENSSIEYTQGNIRNLIEGKENKGNWTFVFLGANMDAWAEGARIGTMSANTSQYSTENMGVTMRGLSAQTQSYYNEVDSGSLQSKDFFTKRGFDMGSLGEDVSP